MARQKPIERYEPVILRIPAEWKRVLFTEAAVRRTTVTALLQPQIEKLVDAIVTLRDTDTDKAA